MSETVKHTIPPVFNGESRILILGSFPSVKSRESAFFYGHPQNRFWRVLSSVFDADVPQTNEEKRSFLISHGVAVWDVIASCEIEGSSDSSIRSVKANDISKILAVADIKCIFVNGKAAEKHYNKYIKATVGIAAVCLPSTSAANASWSEEKLCAEWKKQISAVVK